MSAADIQSRLPWGEGTTPLMLAPMQGLTNRALRGLFVEKVRPDVVFTEFVRIQAGARKLLSAGDRAEVAARVDGTPLVVQLIGADAEALVAAADIVQELGGEHLNINLGCPYGRMTGNSAGGALLRDPVALAKTLSLLRRHIAVGFSVKVRSGFDDPGQVLTLLPVFEDCGVDFLIIHPRTVLQKYNGPADHSITAEAVRNTRLPVIANGDIFSAADGRRVAGETCAAGLMMGRGAIGDPLLFKRLRGEYPAVSEPSQRLAELQQYLSDLLPRYQELFCGDRQILCKMKEVLSQVQDPALSKPVRGLLRCRSLIRFAELLAELNGCSLRS
ncbi:MAG: tRNA-dihydrouridine synthase family protein [Desulfobulbaceae bacterium]|nr:tRNA-dihydrouridine synthase family protein [Desulfobulbaceae bacterium]